MPSTPLHHATPPEAPAPSGPPARASLLAEWRTPLEVARLLWRTPRLVRAPRGTGGPVVLMPGWRSPEASMAPLRSYLAWLGHDASHWGLGVNAGHPERDARRMAQQIVDLADTTGRRVGLVGWSLGGTVARETARLVPDAVSRVVTYGTPAVGGPTHTAGAATYGPDEAARITRLVDDLDVASPIRVPITAIFTRHDGVVAWTACIDRRSPDVDHVEVTSTHLGMGIDPDVWLVVADRLAGISTTPASRT